MSVAAFRRLQHAVERHQQTGEEIFAVCEEIRTAFETQAARLEEAEKENARLRAKLLRLENIRESISSVLGEPPVSSSPTKSALNLSELSVSGRTEVPNPPALQAMESPNVAVPIPTLHAGNTDRFPERMRHDDLIAQIDSSVRSRSVAGEVDRALIHRQTILRKSGSNRAPNRAPLNSFLNDRNDTVTHSNRIGSPVSLRSGREFFKRAHAVLCESDFEALLQGVKRLNEGSLTRTAMLTKAGQIFASHPNLHEAFCRLLQPAGAD